MTITLKLCLKWTLLVTLSAVASFVAALLTKHDSVAHVAGMSAGIATFIVVYVLIEAWATRKHMENFLESLKVGVLIKIGLELIPAIEVFTGILVTSMLERLPVRGDFLATYLKTVITGIILSAVVFAIASVYGYFHNRSIRLATLASQALQ